MIKQCISRHRAVMNPLDERKTRTRAKFVIAAIWVCSVSISIPLLITIRNVPFPYGNDVYQFCDENWTDKQRMSYTLALMLITYVIPLTVIIYTYSRILCVMNKHPMRENIDELRGNQRRRSQKRVRIISALKGILCTLYTRKKS